jgi:hypothetical protein
LEQKAGSRSGLSVGFKGHSGVDEKHPLALVVQPQAGGGMHRTSRPSAATVLRLTTSWS